jgi:hypothetical protein
MKVPQNFSRIHKSKFSIDGIDTYTFYLEPDNGNFVGSAWVFPQWESADMCLLFEIDWAMNKFSVKRCIIGDGTNGDYVILSEPIQKKNVITKTTFINKFIKETVEWLINNKLYKI